MSTGFIIQRNDGVPVFFSAKVKRQYASGMSGWSEDRGQALAFARSEDAQDFIDTYLPHEGVFCTPVPHTFKLEEAASGA